MLPVLSGAHSQYRTDTPALLSYPHFTCTPSPLLPVHGFYCKMLLFLSFQQLIVEKWRSFCKPTKEAKRRQKKPLFKKNYTVLETCLSLMVFLPSTWLARGTRCPEETAARNAVGTLFIPISQLSKSCSNDWLGWLIAEGNKLKMT